MMNGLMSKGDTVLITESKVKLQRMVKVFGDGCWRQKVQSECVQE